MDKTFSYGIASLDDSGIVQIGVVIQKTDRSQNFRFQGAEVLAQTVYRRLPAIGISAKTLWLPPQARGRVIVFSIIRDEK